MQRRCYTRQELASRWRTSVDEVKRIIDSGALPTFRIKRTELIAPEDVRAFEIARSSDTDAAAPALTTRDHFRGI